MLLLSFPVLIAVLQLVLAEEGQHSAVGIEYCPLMEARVGGPKDVHDVRPDDIKVIMTLGDSASAAFGAKLISFWMPLHYSAHNFANGVNFSPLLTTGGIFDEYRGLSFSIGQDRGAVTLTNFLKHYTDRIEGGAIGQHPLTLCWGSTFCQPRDFTYRPMLDGLNAAISGAESSNLSHELDYILSQVHKNRNIDVKEDWKVLTIFIGGNDICRRSCYSDIGSFLEKYREDVRAVILRIKEELPRTIVNVLLLGDLSDIGEFSSKHPRCLHNKSFMFGFCPCAVLMGADGREAINRATIEVNNSLFQIIDELNGSFRSEAERRGVPQTFGIITIPMLRNLDILSNEFPQEFACKLDCFHPSVAAHSNMAKALWYPMTSSYIATLALIV